MQGKPKATDVWLTDSMTRGAGALVGRLTPAGERLFYFRHTDSAGARRLLPIGPYHAKGDAGLSLMQARDRARELSTLYRSGVKGLREHFLRLEEGRRHTEEAARLAAGGANRKAREAADAAARRLTVQQFSSNGSASNWRLKCWLTAPEQVARTAANG